MFSCTPIIQAEAYRLLLDSNLQHVAIMDQAGSGKTLAYLLPMIQLLKQEEQVEREAAAQEVAKGESVSTEGSSSVGATSPAPPKGISRAGAPRLIVAAPTIGGLSLMMMSHALRLDSVGASRLWKFS